MFRKALILTTLVVAPFVVGCSGSPDAAAGEQDETVESTSQDLTHVTISAAVNRAFTFFEGPKSELTIEMRSATLPRIVRSEVAKARRGIYSQLSEEHGMTSSDVDHMNVYAVYTTSTKRTLAGYALWLHANNGSSGAAYLVAFDSRGGKVLEKNDWYQDDQDWE